MKWKILSRLRPQADPSLLGEGDRSILRELRKRGDSLVQARNLIVYFYGDPAATARVADALGRGGWQEVKRYDTKAGERVLGVSAERAQPATQEAIASMLAEIGDYVRETGADFDGWECQLVSTLH